MFSQTISTWYHRTNLTSILGSDYGTPDFVMAGANDFMVHYPDEDSFKSYISSASYGLTADYPIIKGAIQFNSVPSSGVGVWDYSIRLNSTQSSSPGSFYDLGYTIDTKSQVVSTTTLYINT